MRNYGFVTLGLLLAGFGARAGENATTANLQQKTAGSRLVGVTVYQSNALITREVDVPDGAGTLELVVTPLPPQTVNNSLYSEGTDAIRVLTTRFRSRPIKEDTREEVRKLEAQVKELAATAQKIQSDVKTIEQNLALLAKMESFTSATTQHATDKANLNSDAAIKLTKYLMDTRAEKGKEMVALQQQLQANAEQAEFAKRQLQELSAGSTRTERDAVIVVDKRNAPAGKVRLHYLVDSAYWRPQYKLRAGAKEKEPVLLEYLAAIVQQSGENWLNVEVTLSTAQPMLNAAPPDLKTLEVKLVARASMPPTQTQQPNAPYAANSAPAETYRRQARDLRSKGQTEANRLKESEAGQYYNEAAALDQTRELLQPREEMQAGGRQGGAEEGPSVTYHLRSRFSVPSRTEEQIIEVAKLDMAPDYYFKAVPVLTPHIYRLANLTNKSEYVLLPGEATMYVGSDFVGRMNLPLVAIGEQFTAGFGIDPQLQVHRQLVDKSRTTQGGNQVLRYDYRILVNSYKSEPVKLQLWDRLPHAESETAGVSLVKTAPEISTDSLYQREQRPQNLLRWDLTVAPGMNGEKALAVNYEFKLELDRQMLIGNLMTK